MKHKSEDKIVVNQNLLEYIQDNNLNVYDLAVMKDGQIDEAYCQPCNKCNASYSVTKLFIVTMIGILVDSKQLGVDDKIADVLAEELHFSIDPIWNKVTVRHALMHTMGIDYGVIDIDRDNTAEYKTNDYLALIFGYPPKFEPGIHRFYTDVPHYLLSRIIEKITGKKADEAITERILNPLHFSSTAWGRCPLNHTIGSSGAYMSARDMVKIACLYQNEGVYDNQRIISREWVEQVQRNEYDLYPLENSDFYGKAGMNGQMTMFDRKRKLSVAWHSYDEEEKSNLLLVQYFQSLYQ